MKTFKTKKIILIWDFDGGIGQVNSTYPYNFHFENFETEIENVRFILQVLRENVLRSCFAITGFSAEPGPYPLFFPDLISEIASQGHEIASHSWKHEWIPLFTEKQVSKSLFRSKKALEAVLPTSQSVVGFVPPHNRPMTWISKGAYSFGDRGLYPLFKMGNLDTVFPLLKEHGYRWIRVSHRSIISKLFKKAPNLTGRTYFHQGVLVLENHYNGFDAKVIDHILSTSYDTYTVSAHPFMLSLAHKNESKSAFVHFIETLLQSGQPIEFVTPQDLLP